MLECLCWGSVRVIGKIISINTKDNIMNKGLQRSGLICLGSQFVQGLFNFWLRQGGRGGGEGRRTGRGEQGGRECESMKTLAFFFVYVKTVEARKTKFGYMCNYT